MSHFEWLIPFIHCQDIEWKQIERTKLQNHILTTEYVSKERQGKSSIAPLFQTIMTECQNYRRTG